uniref:Transmembrane protein n=1 Tax=Marseillevirus LCMAC101 TaxID=2506602 RepID=A0A481YSV7_9VIRU|nr:MAG: hypothetical protein LCMAC101_07540 [Marseillevirus LCMAC101]
MENLYILGIVIIVIILVVIMNGSCGGKDTYESGKDTCSDCCGMNYSIGSRGYKTCTNQCGKSLECFDRYYMCDKMNNVENHQQNCYDMRSMESCSYTNTDRHWNYNWCKLNQCSAYNPDDVWGVGRDDYTGCMNSCMKGEERLNNKNNAFFDSDEKGYSYCALYD